MIDDPQNRRPQQQPDVWRSNEGDPNLGWPQNLVPDHDADEDAEYGNRSSHAKAAEAKAMDDEKGALAQQLRGLAGAMERVGSELSHSDQPALGRYTQRLGRSVGRLARDCDNRDLGEIAALAEDFGQRQPLAFLGMAAIAGLAASRFLSASAKRSDETPSTTRPEGNWAFERKVGDA
ncbi:nutrient deprivation-induced protein [Ensifer sp. ENS09]|uniref:nutrient deprivation-induced protein n=1 Tax=Ensifer sp. ENS09 TaxID=2769263 RepID=UPI0017872191|nr:nutrient deprivation-induced protein [Ensifer sp. ENS09]MBD9650184.1 nutrient deprivation-induced protein [Ensifer sp. ENS09]